MLGDDAGDELSGRDVEGGIEDIDALGGDAAAADVRDLARATLFDRDATAVGTLEIDRGGRRRNVEGNAVTVCEHRDLVGADLVRDVAARGRAIGTDHDRADPPGLKQMPDHRVGDQRHRNPQPAKLPRRQSRTL